MSAAPISADDPYPRRRAALLGTEIAYLETGAGTPTAVFLHGNPTSSYLWRNVIPHVEPHARCLAPDLAGMGRSGRAADGDYSFAGHARHFAAWMDEVAGEGPVVLVGHDWGGALAFDWARRHAGRVAGIAYMETIVMPLAWEDWPSEARGIFQAMRSPAGEDLVLERNVFVERILPASVLRELTAAEMAVYRAPYAEPGESRLPTLAWPRQIPIEGEPEEVARTVEEYGRWLAASDVPKLFVNAEPGSILTGRAREFCRTWPNQEEVTVAGRHFVQEDSPHEIGAAVARFVRRLAGRG